MTCATCGVTVRTERQHFYEGLPIESWRKTHPGKPWKPVQEWFIDAPMYWKASPDFRRVEAAFCGAEHMIAWHSTGDHQ